MCDSLYCNISFIAVVWNPMPNISEVCLYFYSFLVNASTLEHLNSIYSLPAFCDDIVILYSIRFCFHEDVHSSCILKMPKLETTQMSISGRDYGRTNHGVFIQWNVTVQQNEQTHRTCNKEDESQKHYIEQNKSDIHRVTLSGCSAMKFKRGQNYNIRGIEF